MDLIRSSLERTENIFIKFQTMPPSAFNLSKQPALLRLEDYGYQKINGSPEPAPLEHPPFTLKDIRDAIPPHCFKRSYLRSISYLIVDLIKFFGILWVGMMYLPELPDSIFIKSVTLGIYWFLGCLCMFSIGNLGHEAGHGAFSESEELNDAVGTLCHSLVLIPYYNWKVTHRKHHSHTGDMDQDEVFVPPTRSAIDSVVVNKLEDSKLCAFLGIVFSAILGMPLYFIYNYSGPEKHWGENVNHFDPNSVHYHPSQRMKLWSSNISWGIVFSTLLGWAWVYGVGHVMIYYGVPLVLFYAGFVLLTFLHHTDTYVPHYRGEDWTFLRGALGTVDRSYGAICDHFSHYINPTHVVHHLFPSLPFYHAQEATEAIKPVLGKYYLSDDTHILLAVWRVAMNCRFVEDQGGILFSQKNIHGGNVCNTKSE